MRSPTGRKFDSRVLCSPFEPARQTRRPWHDRIVSAHVLSTEMIRICDGAESRIEAAMREGRPRRKAPSKSLVSEQNLGMEPWK